MATLPSPHAWTAGDDATSTNLQSLTTAILFALGGATGRKPSVVAYNTSGPSLSSGVATTVACDTELIDTDNAYNPSSGVFTCATQGLYVFVGSTRYTNNTSGTRHTRLSSSGLIQLAQNNVSAAYDQSGQGMATLITYLTVGQTVVLQGLQYSGGSLAIRGGADSTWLAGTMVSL